MTEVLFDFYEILVENIFGNVGLSIVGVGIVIALVLLLSRTSRTFFVYWMAFYFIVMGTMYIGALALVFGFLASLVYTLIAFIRLVFRIT